MNTAFTGVAKLCDLQTLIESRDCDEHLLYTCTHVSNPSSLCIIYELTYPLTDTHSIIIKSTYHDINTLRSSWSISTSTVSRYIWIKVRIIWIASGRGSRSNSYHRFAFIVRHVKCRVRMSRLESFCLGSSSTRTGLCAVQTIKYIIKTYSIQILNQTALPRFFINCFQESLGSDHIKFYCEVYFAMQL